MTDLERFAAHCREMAAAQHKPECRAWIQGRSRWGIQLGRWTHPDPDCPGCVTDADRALWQRLAAEVDDYLDPHPTLWGTE